MHNPVRQLIAKRISELKDTTGLTMAEISRQLDRNPAYLQQFITRGVPSELDERDRHKLAELLQLNPDDLRGPGRLKKWTRATERIENLPVTRAQDLLVSHRRSDDLSIQRDEIVSRFLELFRDLERRAEPKHKELERTKSRDFLPVYLLKQDAGSLRISIQPRKLSYDFFGKNAYGVVILGDSMAPELPHETIAIADPDLPPRPNTTCVFRTSSVEEGGEVLVRRLQEISEETFKVYSYEAYANSIKKIETGSKLTKTNLEATKIETLSRKLYQHCHVIVGALSSPVT